MSCSFSTQHSTLRGQEPPASLAPAEHKGVAWMPGAGPARPEKACAHQASPKACPQAGPGQDFCVFVYSLWEAILPTLLCIITARCFAFLTHGNGISSF